MAERILKLDKGGMRQNNSRLLFETIYRRDGITKAQLAKKTGLSAMAVSRITDLLLEQRMIVDRNSEEQGSPGRPAKQLYISPALAHVGISLDIEGAMIGLVGPFGEIIDRETHPFGPAEMPPVKALDIVANAVTAFLAKHALRDTPVIGMSMPGLIDYERANLRFTSQLHWTDVPVGRLLEKRLPVGCVVLDNDVKARAQAESRLRYEKNYERLVLLHIGSGVGAGIVIGHQIYRGKDNLAGELGHSVMGQRSRMCECGQMGCLQATISEQALLAEARMVEPSATMATLESAYHRTVPWARSLLDMTADTILQLIGLLANAYAPDAIVLCGSLIERCAVLRSLISQCHANRRNAWINNSFSLKYSDLGADGTIVGAATIAFNKHIERMITNMP